MGNDGGIRSAVGSSPECRGSRRGWIMYEISRGNYLSVCTRLMNELFGVAVCHRCWGRASNMRWQVLRCGRWCSRPIVLRWAAPKGSQDVGIDAFGRCASAKRSPPSTVPPYVPGQLVARNTKCRTVTSNTTDAFQVSLLTIPAILVDTVPRLLFENAVTDLHSCPRPPSQVRIEFTEIVARFSVDSPNWRGV